MSTTDRIRMIKDIFVDLEKFDLEQKTKKILETCQIQIALKREKLKDVENISPDDIKSVKSEIRKYDTDKNLLEQQKAELEQQMTAIQQVESLHIQYQKLLKQKESITASAPRIDLIVQNIALYEFYRSEIEKPLLLLQRTSDQLKALQKQLEEKNEVRSALASAIKSITENRAKHRDVFDRRLEIERENESKQLFLQYLDIEREIIPLQKKIVSLGESVGEILNEKNKADSELKWLNSRYTTLLSDTVDSEKLRQVGEWYLKSEEIEKRYIEAVEKIRRIDADLETLQLSKNNIIETDFKQLQIPVNTTLKLKETIEILKTKEIEFESERKEISDLVLQLKSNNRFLDAAKQLKDGEPCPLCGAIHHPDIFNADETHQKLTDLQNLDADYKLFLEKCRRVELDLVRLVQQVENLVADKKSYESAQTEIAQQVAQHNNLFIWREFDKKNKHKFELAFNEAQTQKQNLITAQKNIQLLSQKIEKLVHRSHLDQSQKQNFEIQHARLSAQKEAFQNRIPASHFNDWSNSDSRLFKENLEHQNQLLKTAISVFENSEKILSEKMALLQQTEGSIGEIEKQIAENQLSLNEIESQLKIKLEKAPLTSVEAWQKFSDTPFDVATSRSIVNDYNNAKSQTDSDIANVEALLDNRVFSLEMKKELAENINGVKNQIERVIQEKTISETNLKLIETQLKLKEATVKELKSLEYRFENLKKLQSLFSKSGFVNYVSTIYLSDLCRRTNQRFMQLTYNRLQIDINANNDFVIKDNLNGGVNRSIKTLSGGQFFQVSLSLALALAENIQTMYNTEQNFFFLDEGFGSLDSESLTMVFQFLKVLQREKRIVGIISHIKEMQEEIESYIWVTLDDEKGSEIMVNG